MVNIYGGNLIVAHGGRRVVEKKVFQGQIPQTQTRFPVRVQVYNTRLCFPLIENLTEISSRLKSIRKCKN